MERMSSSTPPDRKASGTPPERMSSSAPPSEIQLIELLYQINRRIWKVFAPFFKSEQLSITEVLAMSIMSKKKTSRVTELATVIGVPASTLTGILDRLVEHGFLLRNQDPSDRRSVFMTATPKLESFFRTWTAPIEETLRARLAPMAESRKKRLVEDLRVLMESLEKEGNDGEKSHAAAENGRRGR